MNFLFALALAWAQTRTVYVYRCSTTSEIKVLVEQMTVGTKCDEGRGTWVFVKTATFEFES